VLIVATSGRLTTDTVNWAERQNQSDQAIRIELWPESHPEKLRAQRADLIGEFGLR
jgi:hypothetical protein